MKCVKSVLLPHAAQSLLLYLPDLCLSLFCSITAGRQQLNMPAVLVVRGCVIAVL